MIRRANNLTAFDIIIVGAGPAGLSTALHLVGERPSLRKRLLVLDKNDHHSDKVCGGALTTTTLELLSTLGIELTIPFFHCQHPKLVLGEWSFSKDMNIHIVQRREFDALLNAECQRRGISIKRRCDVTSVEDCGTHLRIKTAEGESLTGKVLVAADGSLSTIRKELGWPESNHPVGTLLRVMHKEPSANHPLFRSHGALADFSPTQNGINGYYWIFPCCLGNEPYTNRGIFDNRLGSATNPQQKSLNELLRLELAKEGISPKPQELRGGVLRNFDPAIPLSRPRVLLVGDAAGADPLFGEGISFALNYGKVAAGSIIEAVDHNDFSFATYSRALNQSPIGRNLLLRTRIATLLAHNHWLLSTRIGELLMHLAPRLMPAPVPQPIRKIKRGRAATLRTPLRPSKPEEPWSQQSGQCACHRTSAAQRRDQSQGRPSQ